MIPDASIGERQGRSSSSDTEDMAAETELQLNGQGETRFGR